MYYKRHKLHFQIHNIVFSSWLRKGINIKPIEKLHFSELYICCYLKNLKAQFFRMFKFHIWTFCLVAICIIQESFFVNTSVTEKSSTICRKSRKTIVTVVWLTWWLKSEEVHWIWCDPFPHPFSFQIGGTDIKLVFFVVIWKNTCFIIGLVYIVFTEFVVLKSNAFWVIHFKMYTKASRFFFINVIHNWNSTNVVT